MKNVKLNTENILDSKELTPVEYKEKILFLLEPILLKAFPNELAKQHIKIHTNRLNFACPYCSDSMRNPHAKRGNLILEGKFINTYKCFNCDQFRSIDQFIKDFDGTLDLEITDYIAKTKVDFDNFIQKKYDISFLLDSEIIEKFALPRDEIKKKLNLDEVENYSVWKWLKHRLQFQKERFLYHPTHNYIVILNLVNNNKVIGLQRRMFKGENKYLTYKLSKLYEFFRPGVEVPDEVDSISTLFGIMELNFAQPVTLFEGPFDSFLFKNSIAISGASKSMPIDLPLRFWFDDDKKGKEKAIEYIEQRQEVFLWDKFKRDHEIPYRRKWDLNDLMIYLKDNTIKTPLFNLYFSNDPLDIIDI